MRQSQQQRAEFVDPGFSTTTKTVFGVVGGTIAAVIIAAYYNPTSSYRGARGTCFVLGCLCSASDLTLSRCDCVCGLFVNLQMALSTPLKTRDASRLLNMVTLSVRLRFGLSLSFYFRCFHRCD